MSLFQNLTRLQKIKLIYTGIYILLNLIVLIESFRFNTKTSDDLSKLLKMVVYIPYLRYFVLLWVLMFLGLIFIHYLEILPLKKKIEQKDQEMLLLKSRLYDFEEGERKKEEEKKDPRSH